MNEGEALWGCRPCRIRGSKGNRGGRFLSEASCRIIVSNALSAHCLGCEGSQNELRAIDN